MCGGCRVAEGGGWPGLCADLWRDGGRVVGVGDVGKVICGGGWGVEGRERRWGEREGEREGGGLVCGGCGKEEREEG